MIITTLWQSFIGLVLFSSFLQAFHQEAWQVVAEGVITRMSEGTPGRTWDLALDDRGRAYVAGVRGVFVFPAEGVQPKRIGTRVAPGSSGRGTYGVPEAVGVRDEVVWVVDGSGRRIVHFDEDGMPVDEWTGPEAPPSLSPEMNLRPLGQVGSDEAAYLEWPDDLGILGTLERPLELYLATADGVKLRHLDDVDARTSLLVGVAEGGYRLLRRQPFSFSDLVATDPFTRMIVLVRRPLPSSPASGAYEVTVYGERGSRIWTARRLYRPVALSQKVFERWVDSVSTDRNSNRPASFYRQIFERTTFQPEYLPPIPNDLPGIVAGPIAFGRDGSVWIERMTGREDTRWDVFRDGKLIATARGPDGIQLMVVDGETGLGIRHYLRQGEYRQEVLRLVVRRG